MSRRPPIGSLEWCEEHGATLNGREKFEVIRNVVRLQAREFAERSRFSRRSMQVLHDNCKLDRITIPDSQIAREAALQAQAICTPHTYQHCIRTYLYGALLAQGQRLEFDPELLFVSSILHDLGISPAFVDQASQVCFARTGAREAVSFVREHGWDETKQRRVYEAVSLHFNPHIDHNAYSVEARFLGEGAQLDVLGLRYQRIPERKLRLVERQHPREDFEDECIRTNTLANHPRDSRPGFGGSSGFDAMVRRNPLNRYQRNQRT